MSTIHSSSSDKPEGADISRRGFVGVTATGLVATALSNPGVAQAAEEAADKNGVIRWGFVGTGSIANAMAKTLRQAPSGQLVASSSRTLEKAEAFAKKHGASKVFDSWQEMIESDEIDAVYVATPTSVREEICVAAANAGKHVLGEKPFASLPSVKRITAACRKNEVAFMDGTHFSHHPRTTSLRSKLDTTVGERRRVESVFQFNIRDASNIRMQPKLEPMGAIGDAGWYNMRAIVEYIDSDATLDEASAYLRRGAETGAVIGATGVVAFTDGSISTWSCGFDAGAGRADLRIDGDVGNVDLEGFIRQDKDGSGSYRYRSQKKGEKRVDEVIRVESSLPGSALMFEDFAAQVHDASLREQWSQKSERTQMLLDAVWESAIQNEKS
ncbi:Gfo/Idh/MocA family protein [Haloferula sp.]|uniref:Gfo/Idh/MocA family protein n=1 Tax=Haloferula sp. TaxID=2497595 RepID=UPI00329ED237